jgi:hypothetical protein
MFTPAALQLQECDQFLETFFDGSGSGRASLRLFRMRIDEKQIGSGRPGTVPRRLGAVHGDVLK